MSQNLNLSVSGLYTAPSDLNGLPPGALNVANNVESRHKNILEPRRGFEGLADSALALVNWIRLINFLIAGTDRTVGLSDEGEMRYYTGGGTPWPAVPGDFSDGIIAPDSVNAKSRFIRAGQNLYLTSQDGIRSLSSGTTAESLRAGVPKGLNIEGETNGDLTGFLENNVVLDTTGTISSAGATITALADTTGIEEGQYVGGIEVAATKVIQDLTYTSELFGLLGNAITVTYVGGGALSVAVVGTAITVTLNTGVSTATLVRAAIIASTAASALVSVAVSGTGGTVQVAAAVVSLAGGLDNTIPAGTTVSSITPEADIVIQTGTTTSTSTTVTAVASITNIVAGVLVSGIGIPEGAKVVSTSGAGPYSVVLSVAAFRTGTLVELTFSSPLVVTMSANAAASLTATSLSFYTGAQVAYRILYGRVETDVNGGTITRLGAASSSVVVNNTTPYSTNVELTATLPKNSENLITFYQLYRSEQTDDVDISPLDQYQLVAEGQLVHADFVARTITITDETPDSLKGVALYSGTDREGVLQSNNPPPMCWDMCTFRDFSLFVNITRPTTLQFTIVSVGSPSGVQVDDTITIAGDFADVPFSQVYTAKSSENAASRQFKIFSSGTPSQNITDTANSLIRVINYDNSLPVHAILISSTTDLPGQILLEADNPSYETFTATASAHATAYDPTLTAVESEVNTINNGIGVSKTGELEAVPSTNLLYAGDSSSDILRCVPLRDYVVIIKTDGIYKVQGLSPSGLVCNPFDLTTKIIGADTAVSLNSGVWMFSNQGVVSISDGGVDAKSPPIDDQLNTLIGSYLDAVTDVSFAIGYESDRKYVLSVPTSDDTVTVKQYVFNYVTNCWSTWDRRLRCAYIHSNEGKLYISRADGTDNGVSKERKSGTYRDFVDEAISLTITALTSALVLELSDVSEVEVGDILYQNTTTFSPILSIDLTTNQVTVESALAWTLGAVSVLTSYDCDITWKQVFGDNPAFCRQFQEGLALFKNTRFNTATLNFVTDFSGSDDEVTIYGTGNGLWGLFGWGEVPWGGGVLPQNIRFYVPQNKQLGSYLIPSLNIKQGYSDFKFQGLAISYENVSQEVGK